MRGQDIAIILTYAIFGGLGAAVFFGVFTGFSYFWVSWLIAAAIISPVSYFARKSDAKCEKCGAAWSLSETHTEDIETKRTFEIRDSGNGKKKIWKDVTYYWQYWKCDKCSDVTKSHEKRDKKVGEEGIA